MESRGNPCVNSTVCSSYFNSLTPYYNTLEYKFVKSRARSQLYHYLTTVSGVGSNPALATCETRQVLLAGVSGGFPGVLPFRATYRLARLNE